MKQKTYYDYEQDWYGRMRPPKAKATRDPNQPAPFEFSRLYGDEKYSLQNMLLAEVNAPRQLKPNQRSFDVWSDRAHELWRQAAKDIPSTYSGDAFYAGVKPAMLMEFARRMAALVHFQETVTGMRIVRYTDAGGYPTLRLDLIGEPHDPPLPSHRPQ